MIHSRKIRPSQKLGFLYEHLCSFAQEILGRSGNSEMDYRKALLTLQKFFGNVGDVYTALSTRINHLECNSRDFNSLLTFASKLNSLADQFIQVSGGDNGKSMISSLLSKLSRNDQAEWNGLLARGLLLDGIISFSEWLLNKVLLQRNCYITTMGEMGTAVKGKRSMVIQRILVLELNGSKVKLTNLTLMSRRRAHQKSVCAVTVYLILL